MITFRDVTKKYDDKVAVNAIDLTVPSGSVFGWIGPNGAGKTTSLRMLATLIKPDAGELTIGGMDVRDDVRDVRRRLGYMPDRFGRFVGVSCYEYLAFFGRLYDLASVALTRRIDDVLCLTDLGSVRDDYVKALSTGMRQRLALAKTLLHDPEILILDEPASGLDPRARIEIRSLLRELGKMGKTIVISSHILSDLEEICSDVAIMERGDIVWNGSLKEVQQTRDCLAVTIDVGVADGRRALELVSDLEGIRSASFAEESQTRIEAQADAGSRGDPLGNRILGALVDAGVEVRGYSEQRLDLEAIFLERTRGLVS